MDQIHLRSNDIVSGIIHLIGAGCAIAVLVVLVVLADEPYPIISYSIYGSGLVLLYLASTFYHLLPPHLARMKELARRFDHAMIYVLIAATYTPIAFLALTGAWKWTIFGIIWGLALIGVAIKSLFAHPGKMSAYTSTILYVVMGWLIVIAIVPLHQSMSFAGFATLVAGGVVYTIGTIFFALDDIVPKRKHFWMHEIFHIFILGGSSLHTITMFLLL